MALEQLLVLALFIAVVLSNLFVRWLRRRAAEQDEPTPRPGPPARMAPSRAVRQPQPLAPPRRAPTPPEALPPIVPAPGAIVRPARVQSPARLGGRAALRRAIVLMSVLGPCRALRPEDPDAMH